MRFHGNRDATAITIAEVVQASAIPMSTARSWIGPVCSDHVEPRLVEKLTGPVALEVYSSR